MSSSRFFVLDLSQVPTSDIIGRLGVGDESVLLPQQQNIGPPNYRRAAYQEKCGHKRSGLMLITTQELSAAARAVLTRR